MTATSSLTEQNRATVESMYAAVTSGDIEGFLSHLADDIVIDEPLYLPYGKVYRGKREFLELFPKLNQYVDASQIKVHYLIADGDRVAACLGLPDVNTGKAVHLLEQSTLRDGKVAEIKLFYYDAGTMMDAPKIV
jgi:hypothetical protein